MLTSPLDSETEWGQLLRNVQQSIGGWGSELLELRRSERLIPMWCSDVSMCNFSLSDAE